MVLNFEFNFGTNSFLVALHCCNNAWYCYWETVCEHIHNIFYEAMQ